MRGKPEGWWVEDSLLQETFWIALSQTRGVERVKDAEVVK